MVHELQHFHDKQTRKASLLVSSQVAGRNKIRLRTSHVCWGGTGMSHMCWGGTGMSHVCWGGMGIFTELWRRVYML